MLFDGCVAKQLKPGEHLVVEGCEGLRLGASASKMTWTYRCKQPGTGRMKQTRIGPYPKLRPSEAAELVEALRLKRADGIDPKEYQQQRRKPAVIAPADAEVFTVRKLLPSTRFS
ncbi:UNVERIFIED_ORG: hypothetical protein J2W38_002785 [Variovorax paradoxus]|nr:hypothetical protein [Variovorax paradoxus]